MPEPSRIAGVMPTRRGSAAAMSHSHWPKTWLKVGLGAAAGVCSQIKKMVQNFKLAKRVLGTNATRKNVVAVNGCCYGVEPSEEKGDYLKKCGQTFWSFIS